VTTARLRPFLFTVSRADGTFTDVVFYASTAKIALQYAETWARRMGHVRVVLMDREMAA
jgi:hypothetical protein